MTCKQNSLHAAWHHAAPTIAAKAAAERRIAHVRLLDAAGVAGGDRAVVAALARLWTPSLAARHGPAASPRSARRWRIQAGDHRRPAAADLTDVPRGPRPDARHAMVAALALRAFDRPGATFRDVHAMHAHAVHVANIAAAATGGAPVAALSYSTVRRVASAALDNR